MQTHFFAICFLHFRPFCIFLLGGCIFLHFVLKEPFSLVGCMFCIFWLCPGRNSCILCLGKRECNRRRRRRRNVLTRIIYGNGKYIALDGTNQVYSSIVGMYFNLQSSNLNTIINTNYSATYIIHDGTKFIACGYCISAGPAICHSSTGLTWTGCSGCSNLNLNYIAYNRSLYLAHCIFGYLLKSTNGTS